jgi:hypothetical protein
MQLVLASKIIPPRIPIAMIDMVPSFLCLFPVLLIRETGAEAESGQKM